MDITEEFAIWLKCKGLEPMDDNDGRFYDLWAEFIDEEYNDQRNWQQPAAV